jgi:hypothetical protein
VDIDWASFGEVFVVSFGVAVGVIVVFAIGVGLLSAPAPASEPSPQPTPDGLHVVATDATTSQATATPAAPSLTRRLIAGVCFLACALTVGYGLFIIISK